MTELDSVMVEWSERAGSVFVDETGSMEEWVVSEPEGAVVESGVGEGGPDDNCEVMVSAVDVGDAEVEGADAEGATEEDVVTAADGELSDVVAEGGTDDGLVGAAGLEIAPVPKGTFCRFCKAMSISWTATTR